MYGAFRRFAHSVSISVGAPWAFIPALAVVGVWARDDLNRRGRRLLVGETPTPYREFAPQRFGCYPICPRVALAHLRLGLRRDLQEFSFPDEKLGPPPSP